MPTMIKRLCALVCALMLLATSALADLAWPASPSPAQTLLMDYIALVNQNLTLQGRGWVNSIFECYPTFAVLGVTAEDMSPMPEGVELSFTLNADSLDTLQLRVSDPTRFAALAASCIQAASPGTTTLQDALADPTLHADRAIREPGNSFEDEVIDLNGPAPRTYYAYYPNQYRDGVNWLQMTLIFPLPGSDGSGIAATSTPPPADPALEYEGYHYDGGTHLEIFTTPTPEPDSPAAE